MKGSGTGWSRSLWVGGERVSRELGGAVGTKLALRDAPPGSAA
jgi:hypothetical protein